MRAKGSSLRRGRRLTKVRSVKAGEIAELAVQSLTLEGEGVGSLEERSVYCRGAFPGERARVRIEAVSRHHPRAHARVVALLEAHPARRKAPCFDHESRLGRCTGCALMELGEDAQREAKRTMLRDRFGFHVTIEAAPAQLGYRHSSKRVALTDARSGGPYLGSFAQGSHQPASMANCLVDHPALMRAFQAVESGIRSLAIVPYDEELALGDLRYVWAKTNGEQVIVTLVTASEQTRIHELVPLLKVAGVLHSVQAGRGNAMRGSPARVLAGSPEVTISLLEQSVEVGALGFVQPNPQVAAAAYRALTEQEGEPGLAFDLYAGAGVTTRLLRTKFRQVIACEAQPESAAALGVAASSVEAFLASAPAKPDFVIANPPRKGLGPEVCASLCALEAPLLNIMSCGPAGLARDLVALSPRYALRALRAFDTLPQTPHVELVAQLELIKR
jgi:23S rRNA (uracil1939-C5)-methyltransferase